jgi:p-hydroxybenzoate 3-monooxygenase
MRTQVAIIGAGPAGLLLSQLLQSRGLDCVVLERRGQDYVQSRIRAGVIEQTTVELLAEAGADRHLRERGLPHAGFNLCCDGEMFRIDMAGLTGAGVVVYGQTELTRDLIETCHRRGTPLMFGVQAVTLHDLDGSAPYVTYEHDGAAERLECDFIAGCDGSHGVCRDSIPAARRTAFERAYPFGWLGILADVPPCGPELTYSNHERGFALASMRSPTRSRYYLQCALDEPLADWSDERIWDELSIRLGPTAAAGITRGPALEKSVTPLRSFVSEPMRHGRLFLAGDAAHIVPPTGAKGLNLAAADAGLLSEALAEWYRGGSMRALDAYSSRALARVWKAERFSWWLTSLTHRFPDMDPFARRLQVAELQYIRASRAAQTVLAENYVGLPLR